MRRAVVAITLCLLFGVLVSATLAWAAAWLFDPASADAQGASLNEYQHIFVYSNAGATQTNAIPKVWSMFSDRSYSGSQVPNLIGPVDDVHEHIAGAVEGVAETFSVGWPMRCFYYTRMTTDYRMVLNWDYENHGVLFVGNPLSEFELTPADVRTLPTAVYWPGLVVNTLLVAGALCAFLLLLYANRKQRATWKRRRNKCVFCSYELHGAFVRCPECGRHAAEAIPIIGRFVLGPLAVACIVLLAACSAFLILAHLHDPTPALHYAAYHGNAQRVTELLAEGADPDELLLIERDDNRPTKLTPLVAAAVNCHHETVQVLLEAGADATYPINGSYDALDAALQHECYDCAEAMLRAGFDINAPTQFGATPFLFPAHYGNLDAVNLLLDYGGNPALDEIALRGAILFDHEAVARLLLEHGAVPNESAMSTAVRKGNTVLFDELIACGGDPSARSNSGETLLFALREYDSEPNYSLLQRLIDEGIDVNAQNNAGETALMHAAGEWHDHHLTLFLLRNGADPNLLDANGQSALCWAVSSKRDLNALLLIAYGADPRYRRYCANYVVTSELFDTMIEAADQWTAFDEQ